MSGYLRQNFDFKRRCIILQSTKISLFQCTKFLFADSHGGMFNVIVRYVILQSTGISLFLTSGYSSIQGTGISLFQCIEISAGRCDGNFDLVVRTVILQSPGISLLLANEYSDIGTKETNTTAGTTQ